MIDMNYFSNIKVDKKYNGYVMRQDNQVATVIDGEVTDINELAPLYLRRTRNFSQWVIDRGADLNRSYIRSILRHLGLPLLNEVSMVMSVNAVSVIDTFWFKEFNSSLCYEDVKFSQAPYFKASLVGDSELFNLPRERSPQLTVIGSFNKGWNLINNEWVLFKSGTRLEIFSELFVSKLAKYLGIDTVDYWVQDGFIVCNNFIKGGDCFEPAKSLVNDNIDYIFNADVMNNLGLLNSYLNLIFLDVLVRNADRHEFNYGFITSEDGSIKLAPNFDNNLALFYNGIPSNLSRRDVLVTEFIELLDYLDNKGLNYNLPTLTPNIIKKVYNELGNCEIPLDTLTKFCMNAHEQIL